MKLKSMQEVENVPSLSSNVMYDSFHPNP
jgi:hypothetical protein